MRAGALKYYVTFERPTKRTVGAHGGRTKAWETHASAWASMEPLSALEYIETHQLESEVSVRFIIRYRPDLNTHMRIKYGTRYFKIVGRLNAKAQNRYLEIMALETEDFE